MTGRGIMTAWVLVLLGLVFYAVAWYPMAFMLVQFNTTVSGAYSFPSGADAVQVVLGYVVAWHPIIAIFGWLLYGILASASVSRRGYTE